MKRIASFEVNHDKLKPGMYTSRIDGDVTTYDIRMVFPMRALISSRRQGIRSSTCLRPMHAIRALPIISSTAVPWAARPAFISSCVILRRPMQST